MEEFFKNNSLSFYSLIIYVLIFFQAKYNLKNNDNKQNRMWIEIIVISFFVQFLDIISWIYIYLPNNITQIISYACNTALFILLNLCSVKLAFFIEYSIDFSKEKDRFLHKLFVPILIINTILIVLSIPLGFYYSYHDNVYIRGDLNFLFFFFVLLPLAFVFIRILFKYKGNSNLRIIFIVGMLFPFIFAVIHVKGILPVPIMFPSFTLCALVLNSLFINNAMCVDFLTGLQNKRGISKFFSNLPVTLNSYIAAVYIDINGFKNINDKYGHKEGDIALTAFAKILGKATKISDFIARVGGDEFLIITMLNNEKDIKLLINRLSAEIDNYNELSQKPYKIEISYGINIVKMNDYVNKDKLIEEADKRMYINKYPDRNIREL